MGACFHLPSVTCDNCRGTRAGDSGIVHEYPPTYIVRGQKCAQCGSTAIDHTEANCQINRQIKPKVK